MCVFVFVWYDLGRIEYTLICDFECTFFFSKHQQCFRSLLAYGLARSLFSLTYELLNNLRFRFVGRSIISRFVVNDDNARVRCLMLAELTFAA